MGRLETGRAPELEAAQRSSQGEETDVAHSRHVHTALGIQFPLIMGCAFRLDRWGRQFTVLLRAPREVLSFEQRRDARATWQRVIGPAEINAPFRKERSRPPAWMCPTHLHDGLAHARRHRAQWSRGGPAHVRAEAGAPLMLRSEERRVGKECR